MSVVTVFEWGRYDRNELPLSDEELGTLQKFSERVRVEIATQTVKGNKRVVSFSRYVGTIRLSRQNTLEILPKLAFEDVVTSRRVYDSMIQTVAIKPFRLSRSDTLSQAGSISDTYVSWVLEEVWRKLHRGLPVQHQLQAKQERYIKGKWSVGKDLAHGMPWRGKFSCKYYCLEEDNLVTRYIKAGLRALAGTSNLPLDDRRYIQAMAVLRGVKDIRISSQTLSLIYFGRDLSHYQNVCNVIHQLLFGKTPGMFFGTTTFGLNMLLNMDVLFQKFVGECLRKEVPGRVRTEGPVRALCSHPTEGEFSFLKPDITIIANGRVEKVFECKWKYVRSYSNVDVDDLRQAYVYSKIYGCEDVVLVYPGSNEFIDQEVVTVNELHGVVKLWIVWLPLHYIADQKLGGDILRSLANS